MWEILGTITVLGVGAAMAFEGKTRWLAMFIGFSSAGLGYGISLSTPNLPLDVYRPLDQTRPADAEFSSSRGCRSCHQATYASWHKSYHRRMTQPPSAENIVAPFDGRVLTDGPRKYRVFMQGDTYTVEMPKYGTNGLEPRERQILPVV